MCRPSQRCCNSCRPLINYSEYEELLSFNIIYGLQGIPAALLRSTHGLHELLKVLRMRIRTCTSTPVTEGRVWLCRVCVVGSFATPFKFAKISCPGCANGAAQVAHGRLAR